MSPLALRVVLLLDLLVVPLLHQLVVRVRETVYVTKGSAPSPTPSADKPATPENETPEAEYPASSQVPSGALATPTPLYPTGNNGTFPGGPTGFMTSTKPTYPIGTGVPSQPSETSQLPTFSIVTDAGTPVAPTPSPAASSTASGGYGNGYPAVPAVPEAASSASSVKASPSPTPADFSGNGGYGTDNYGAGY
ncbi:predicted protein [Plenodomus lingam JN3]|uniref:Predicted protein n=1 Tax=Leptosphaeria maculans (strain JN3 / isolate v23.1.3 / race Av1-4-5-6-7-8) TaxID=985895 RepID=E5R4T4_LEPMJ|nr:predicted protein [Plenodomus lingam JN3]CBX92207.1 predicted protein [Plenodomus lingam JN3]